MEHKIEIQEFVSKLGSRYSDAKVEEAYRMNNCIQDAIQDLSNAECETKLRFHLRTKGIGIMGDYKDGGVIGSGPVAVLASAEHFDGAPSHMYLITLRPEKFSHEYLGPDILETLKKYSV